MTRAGVAHEGRPATRGRSRAARRVQVGGILINDVPQLRVDPMPYGGVRLSGTGREGPRFAIGEMTEIKLVSGRAS